MCICRWRLRVHGDRRRRGQQGHHLRQLEAGESPPSVIPPSLLTPTDDVVVCVNLNGAKLKEWRKYFIGWMGEPKRFHLQWNSDCVYVALFSSKQLPHSVCEFNWREKESYANSITLENSGNYPSEPGINCLRWFEVCFVWSSLIWVKTESKRDSLIRLVLNSVFFCRGGRSRAKNCLNLGCRLLWMSWLDPAASVAERGKLDRRPTARLKAHNRGRFCQIKTDTANDYVIVQRAS